MIFEYFPMSSLLLNQRVCKGWQHTISSTITLQRKLYFEPMQGDPLALFHWGMVSQTHEITPNVYHKIDYSYKRDEYHLPASEQEAEHFDFMWAPETGPRVPVEVVENPILYDFEAMLDDSIKQSDKNKPSLPEAFARPEASWRRMLVCQPSIKTSMRVRIYDRGGSGFDVYCGKHAHSKDYRLGDISDRLSRRKYLKRLRFIARGLMGARQYQALSVEFVGSELWEENQAWTWPEVTEAGGADVDESEDDNEGDIDTLDQDEDDECGEGFEDNANDGNDGNEGEEEDNDQDGMTNDNNPSEEDDDEDDEIEDED